MRYRQVHLDFHTSEAIEGIGSKFSKEQFQSMLKKGHVDSITVFSKCHHGWAYHPSEANDIHPHLNFDLLGAQIEAAHEIGVKTPVYLSAGFDEKIARRKPQWLSRRKDEKLYWVETFAEPGYHRLCLNSPYLDYLLEQIKEVCRNYDADGIFLDIVAVHPCWCQNCIKTLRDEGKDPYDDKNIYDLAYRTHMNYMKRVREAIDSVTPGMPVFHNSGHVSRGRREMESMNSHYELESLPTGGWGYDHFPMSARYVQLLDKDYLSMTGKFHLSWGEFGGYKHPNALRYEVALAAANGAKCSVGDQLHPYGNMDEATYALIGKAYGELEEKEPWLEGVQSVADIGVLSYESVNSRKEGFDKAVSDTADYGCLRVLQEGNYLFDVLDLQNDFSKYKVIILPDGVRIGNEAEDKLREFVKNGGKLLATGKSGLYEDKDEFAFDFGAEYIGENELVPSYFYPNFELKDLGKASYVCYEKGEHVKVTEKGTELAKNENSFFNREVEHFCSHRHSPASQTYGGAGMTMGTEGIYIAWNMFSEYRKVGSIFAKYAIEYALNKLLGERKSIETNLGAQGIVTLMQQEKENRYIAHILYAVPVRRGEIADVIEDLPVISETEIKVRIPQEVKGVYLAPQNKKIEFKKEEDGVSVIVDKFECHQMIVFDV